MECSARHKKYTFTGGQSNHWYNFESLAHPIGMLLLQNEHCIKYLVSEKLYITYK